ncbi:hypothetical protein AAAC51_13905 [Priestia megaterium]
MKTSVAVEERPKRVHKPKVVDVKALISLILKQNVSSSSYKILISLYMNMSLFVY